MEEEARRKDTEVKWGPISFFCSPRVQSTLLKGLRLGGCSRYELVGHSNAQGTRLSTLLVPFLEPEQVRASMGVPTQSTKDTEEMCHKAASTGWIYTLRRGGASYCRARVGARGPRLRNLLRRV